MIDREFPYFINPAIDALAKSKGEERIELVRLIAANVGDESALRRVLGLDSEEFKKFYPDMLPHELNTEDTISSFISRFSNEKSAEVPEIEEIIAAPALDYAYMLEQEEDLEEVSHDDDSESDESDATADAISAFLHAVPPKMRVKRKENLVAPELPARHESLEELRERQTDIQESVKSARENGNIGLDENRTQNRNENENDSSNQNSDGGELSEALFRLMVGNKNYAKALEIISELSLKNPKKSIYFAYQKRFLEKLIANQSRKKS